MQDSFGHLHTHSAVVYVRMDILTHRTAIFTKKRRKHAFFLLLLLSLWHLSLYLFTFLPQDPLEASTERSSCVVVCQAATTTTES